MSEAVTRVFIGIRTPTLLNYNTIPLQRKYSRNILGAFGKIPSYHRVRYSSAPSFHAKSSRDLRCQGLWCSFSSCSGGSPPSTSALFAYVFGPSPKILRRSSLVGPAWSSASNIARARPSSIWPKAVSPTGGIRPLGGCSAKGSIVFFSCDRSEG